MSDGRPTGDVVPVARHRPVFIDESGRRARWVALLGRAVGGVCVGYVVLVAASLLGAPWVPHEVLPSVGPTPQARTTPVTLPGTAARQPAPSLPARHATTTAPSARSTTTATTARVVTPTSTVPGRPVTPSTTTAGASSSTTVSSSPSGTAPGRVRRG